MEALAKGNPALDIHFVVCDDNSNDGTYEALWEMPAVTVIRGDGKQFYTGGMRLAIQEAQSGSYEYEYVLLFNDDVAFYPHAIEKMIAQITANKDADVVVGCTQSSDGKLSYGGVVYHNRKRLKFRKVEPNSDVLCDTFNANCVLIPGDLFLKTGNMDPVYRHSLGDFDYGFRISKMGGRIVVSNEFVGICNDNPSSGTWMDRSLSPMERIKKKESVKGVPSREWFHYVRKHFGLVQACVYTVTPYIKILLGK